MQLSLAHLELETTVDGLSSQAWRYCAKAPHIHLQVYSCKHGRSRGGPGVPVTPLLQAFFLTKQPTTVDENAMKISWP